MGKPYDERRKTLNLAVYKLRQEGWSNREIAQHIGIEVDKVPGMALAGSRIAQTLEHGSEAAGPAATGGPPDGPPMADAEA